MNKSKDELAQYGLTGSLLFWIRIILCVIPIGMLIFSIYWMAMTASKIWIQVVGSAHLALNIILMLFSAGSLVFMIFGVLSIMKNQANIVLIMYIVITLISALISLILLGISSEQNAIAYQGYFSSHCISINSTDSFCQEYFTDWSKKRYVRVRTTDAYDCVAGILSPWIIFFIIFGVIVFIITKNDGPKDDNQILTEQPESGVNHPN